MTYWSRRVHRSKIRAGVCLVAVIACAAIADSEVALGAQVTLPSTTTIAGVGATAAVGLTLSPADGVEGADVILSYDPAVVRINGEAATTVLTGGCTPVTNAATLGSVRVALACTAALSGSGVLFTLPLLGSGSGISALTIDRCELNEGAIPCTSVNGSVQVSTPTATPTHTATQTATFTPTNSPPPTATPTRTASATRTPSPSRTPTLPPRVTLNPLGSPIVVGQSVVLGGSGFTAGSRIVAFVSDVGGVKVYGPFQPTSWTPTSLTWAVPTTILLGNGFASIVVVNSDQGFIESNPQSQYLFGAASANIPTILTLNGVALRPVEIGVPVANVETVVAQGSLLTIGGTGFNSPLVNLYTPGAAFGPLVPQPGGTSTQFAITVPVAAPTGPGAVQVINNPYAGNVVSNSVSVPLGAALTITSVSQLGSTITVDGTGFAAVSVINFFNQQPTGVVNLGGYGPGGQPRIPLTVASSNRFTFALPAGAVTGPAYVQVVNPPYVPFSSTGGDPDGAFTATVP